MNLQSTHAKRETVSVQIDRAAYAVSALLVFVSPPPHGQTNIDSTGRETTDKSGESSRHKAYSTFVHGPDHPSTRAASVMPANTSSRPRLSHQSEINHRIPHAQPRAPRRSDQVLHLRLIGGVHLLGRYRRSTRDYSGDL